MFYGLDWIATVPPTVKITADRFGREKAGMVFGWIFAGHQIGAASAAFGAGLIRTEYSTYLPAFFVCRRAVHHRRGAGDHFGAQIVAAQRIGAPAAYRRGHKVDFRLASILSQISAAMSGPPRFFTERMPVGEVTLISVR